MTELEMKQKAEEFSEQVSTSHRVLADLYLGTECYNSVTAIVKASYLAGMKEATIELPDVEKVSALVHLAWMSQKSVQGMTTRQSETGEELMVPYDQLSEAAKDLDRNSVLAVYNAIRLL